MEIKFLRPLSDRVLIQPLASEKEGHNVLYLPQHNQDNPEKGIVLAVGKCKDNRFLEVKTGDNVLYDKEAGLKIKVDGIEGILLKECNIYAVIESKTELEAT